MKTHVKKKEIIKLWGNDVVYGRTGKGGPNVWRQDRKADEASAFV